MRRDWKANLLEAAQTLLVATGFTLYTFASDSAPHSLSEAIGSAARVWNLVLIITALASGICALRQHRLNWVKAETAFRVISGAAALGYALGIILGPTSPWITIFITIGYASSQARRCYAIWTGIIPQIGFDRRVLDHINDDSPRS